MSTSKVSLQRLDRRSTRYRFDLEADIPWARIDEPGCFAGPSFLRALGVRPELCDAPAGGELQWVLAAVTARTFVALEGDVCDFVSAQGTGRPSRSTALLLEEEQKHRTMFQRFVDRLNAAAPERARDLDRVWKPAVSWSAITSGAQVDVPEHASWLVWLATLFFEEYTVWIHRALAPDAAIIQPAWLAAHACHEREELQHVLTDAAYLDALDLSEADRRRLARSFQLFLETGFDRLLGLDVVSDYMHLRGVDVFRRERTLGALPFRGELLEHEAFARTRAFMPALRRLRGDPGVAGGEPLSVSPGDLLDHLRRSRGTITLLERGAETCWTPAELLARAERRLAGFQARGLRRGDVVLITTSRTDVFLTTYWACLLGGLIPAPLDADHDRFEAVRRAVQPAFVAGDDAEGLDAGGAAVIEPGEVAVLQFTSGSTATPHGVRLTHANVVADAVAMTAQRRCSPDDVFASWLPLFHDMGLIGFHLAPIVLGASQVLLTPDQFAKNPMTWVRALHRHKATVTGGPSSALAHLVKRASRRALDGFDLSHVHCWLVGAEPISIAVLEEAARVFAAAKLRADALSPGYGLAEASLGVTITPPELPRACIVDRHSSSPGRSVVEVGGDHPRAVALADCGPPIPGVTVRITHRGRVVPAGVVGRIEVSGPNVGGDPPPAWLDTGDLGFLRGGRLFVTGREKDVFFIDGRTYHAHDVERVALELDEVRPNGAALLVHAADRDGLERRTLFVAPARAADAQATLARVARHVAERTGVPLDELVAVARNELPRTTSGKLRRRELGVLLRDERAGERPRWTPAGTVAHLGGSETLSLVREVWAAALELPLASVGPDDDFLALGGRSLIAAEIHGRLEDALDRHLAPELLLRGRTPRLMAAWLDGAPLPAEDEQVRSVAAATAAAPIAVVGVAVRLPGADDTGAFWRILVEGRSLIRDVPADRFDAAAFVAEAPGRVRRVTGAFLDDVTRFDPQAFGFDDAVAEALDPQQRLFLEVALEALEQGLVPGDRAGVFVASGDNEYALRYRDAPERAGRHALLGALRSMIAGRVASVFGLTGPVLTVDTACSSSLAAVHLAVRSLQAGECDVALAGGVQVNLTDQAWRYFRSAGLLSPDGECRPFDRDAAGLVPGEGAIALLLAPLPAALARGDRVWGVIRGSAMNNDGGAMTGTAPNPRAQRASMEQAWASAGLDPETATYVEAHAAGTALGDALEVASIARVFAGASLHVGSVKSNLGHTFAVSGVAGLVKVLLALRGEAIPPTVGCPHPAERLAFSGTLGPARELIPWPRGDRPRRAGVDSFGLGGTNVHVVVEEAPRRAPAPPSAPPVIYPVAAANGRSSAAAAAHAGARGSLQARAAAAIRASRWGPERRAIVAADTRELDAALRSLTPETRRLSSSFLIVPGPGSQRAGMGRALAAREPTFGAAWARCREAFRRHALDLEAQLDEARVDHIDAAQPAVFSFAYAAWRWLEHLGLCAAGFIGHSAGELLAAHAAGVLSFEDAVALVAARGRAMADAPAGGMIAVFAGEAATRAVIARDGLPLAVAGINAPGQTVVSGARGDLEPARARFQAAGLAAHLLPVGTPAHSPLMAPVAEVFAHAARHVELGAPERRWISTCTGQVMGRPGADHFARQLMEPVRFTAAIEAALAEGAGGFIELGATAGLTACVEAIAGERALAISLGRKDEDEVRGALEAIAGLWSAGADLHLHELAGGAVEPASPPPRTWARRRLWIETTPEPPRPATRTFSGDLPSIADHHTGGRTTAPAALLIDRLLAELDAGEPAAGLTRVLVESPLALADGEVRSFTLSREDGRVALSTDAAVHLRATLSPNPRRTFDRVDLAEVRRRCARALPVGVVYEVLRATGFDVGPRMRGVRSVRAGDGELLAELATPPGGDRGRWIDPALLDGASQAVAALFAGAARSPRPYLGFSIGTLSVWTPVHEASVAVIQLRSGGEGADVLRYDILLCDAAGKLLAEVRDFAAKRPDGPAGPEGPAPVEVAAPRAELGGEDELLARLRAEVSARVRRPEAAISLDDGLARLGLDSLKAVAVVAALEAHYGVALPATFLFEVRTLREAAHVLRTLLREGRG